MGETPDLCLYQENSLFPHRNLVTAFQTHFAAQWPYARWRGCGGSSVPISSRHIIWGFFCESVHSASFKRQTRRTLLPRSEGKSSGIIFLPNAFPRRPHASAAPGPCVDRSTSTPLWFVLSDVETCLAFMKTTPVMLAHWAVLIPGIHSSHFLLGQRVCEQWRHHYAMQTKCWAHWCHIWWRSYV